MKKIYIFVVVALMLSACSALRVEIDYDTAYNFTKNTTYAVVYNAKEGDNTLINDRIESAIKTNIKMKGYTEVSKEKAELILVFHVQVTQMSDIRTDYQTIGYGGYGYGGGWGHHPYGGFSSYSSGAMVIPTATTYRWKEGQLIIDAYNPQTKKVIWRGVIKDEITGSNHTVSEKTEYINKVVKKVLKEFPEI